MQNTKVTNFETLEARIAEMRKAQAIYSTYTQQQVDRIFKAAAMAISEARISLAKEAVEETKMGKVEDKAIKNHVASELLYNKYKDLKTAGLVAEDLSLGTETYAEPVGIIAAVVPTTNPTSTAAFKVLSALKTRNAIFIAAHPRAQNCTIHAAKIAIEAAVKAGAPEGLLGWIDGADEGIKPQDMTFRLMELSDLILATGGPGMVRAAYTSGTPAVGVGAGNTPVIFDETANIKMAVSSVIQSKTFDNGVICASEQSVIISAGKYEETKAEFIKRGAYFLTKEELKKLNKKLLVNGLITAEVVGQDVEKIAEFAGVKIPKGTKLIIGEVSKTSRDEPFAHEKLSVLLAMYKYEDFNHALTIADELSQYGLGHTAAIYADELVADDRIHQFARKINVGRILINQPASHGAVGDIYNFGLNPSLTLGCGTWGGNSISENVGPQHLINTKVIAKRRENMLWFKVPEKTYFKFGCLAPALADLVDMDVKKAFIVTDRTLVELGFIDKITNELQKYGIHYSIFQDVEPDPTIINVLEGAKLIETFQPDTIIAFGGGSPIDAAKMMWLYYENPEAEFKDLAATFLDIRKRITKFPNMGKKAKFIAIPTTAGTGSEVTPFSVITDVDGTKYPLADYALTPHMAIVDPEFTLTAPNKVTAASGIDVLVHAVESYVSIVASDYTKPLSLSACRLVFDNLEQSYVLGVDAKKAKENMANASCMAGMAFANAFLGICHSMAHKLGGEFHLAHGFANALLINEVIKFNANDNPRKMGTFSQYEYPQAIERYAEIARFVGLTGKDDLELTNLLINKIEELKQTLNIPSSIKEYGVNEQDFLAALDKMAEDAFNDQCTGANPVYPSIEELKQIYLNAYYGNAKK